MFSLKDKDPETWNMFNGGNFSVNKTLIYVFCYWCRSCHRAGKQSSQSMGGIKGIASNRKVLDEYFLTVSEMGNIIQDFCDIFNIQNEAPKRTQHYQLTGSKNERINDNVKKCQTCFAHMK